MSCPICAGKGVTRVNYHDGSPTDYGICLCEAGQILRSDRNAGRSTGYPLWMVWAAEREIPHERIAMVEDLLDEHELATIPREKTSASRRAIADVMISKRPRL
jgi:hypothetical protein